MTAVVSHQFQTVCGGCRRWVPGIFHVTLDKQHLCIDCAAKIGVPTGPVPSKAEYIGPPPTSTRCSCGRAAAASCDGCGVSFCEPCWWRHSHAPTFAGREGGWHE